jgi:hypothetical protein
MWKYFEELVWRPCTALVFSLEVATREIAPRLIVDAVLSRAVHTLSRQRLLRISEDKVGFDLGASTPSAAQSRGLPERHSNKFPCPR